MGELLKKKTDRDAKWNADQTAWRATQRTNSATNKAETLKRSQAHWEAYQKEQRRLVDAARTASANGQLFVPAQPQVLLVVRIKGINKMNPKAKLIMRLLRLRQIHNAVFIKLNKASANMLKKVEPWIAYGIPNRKTVEQLLYGRVYGKVNNARTKLDNNGLISNALGEKCNVTCMEDLLTEIYNCGPNFKQANNFLWPFKLNPPKGGYGNKVKPYLNGGDCGDRGAYINEFVRR